VQCVVLACVAVWFSHWTWRSWPAWKTSSALPPVDYRFPDPMFANEDLHAYADGHRADGALARALAHDEVTGVVDIEVAFMPPKGLAFDTHAFGWPVEVYSVVLNAHYDDVYARSGVQPVPQLSQTTWSSFARITRSTNAAGQTETHVLMLAGLLQPVVIVWLAWWTGASARARAATRGRRWRCLPWVSTGIAATLSLVLAMQSRDYTEPIVPMPSPTTIPLHVTTGEVLALAREPGGEARLAQAIIDAAGEPAPGEVLAVALDVGTDQRVAWRSGGWPGFLVSQWRSELKGESLAEPYLARAQIHRGALQLTWADRQPTGATSTTRVSLTAIWIVAACACAVWSITGLLASGAARWRRRRARRRIDAGLCAWCAYQVRA
jgi:hypothetical protein